MLVILIDSQQVLPGTICQSCPMASQSGQPRWQAGQLRCGRPVDRTLVRRASQNERPQYECTMGFLVAELAD